MTRRLTLLEKRELGAKRARCKFRICEALANNGWSITSLAKDMGLSDVAVGNVIRGTSHSPRILDRLRTEGVAEKYLFDPRGVTPEPTVTAKGHS